jgi:hypothetical protein
LPGILIERLNYLLASPTNISATNAQTVLNLGRMKRLTESEEARWLAYINSCSNKVRKRQYERSMIAPWLRPQLDISAPKKPTLATSSVVGHKLPCHTAGYRTTLLGR